MKKLDIPNESQCLSSSSHVDSSLDRVLLLSVLLLLFHADTSWIIRIPFQVLCSIAILFPTARKSLAWWSVATLYMIYANASDWHIIDNHKYLITLWAICVTFWIYLKKPVSVLGQNAGVMIGICFGFATLWKVTGGEYYDGTFIASTLLLDSRTHDFVTYFDLATRGDLQIIRSSMDAARSTPYVGLSVEVDFTNRLVQVSKIIGWMTVLGEGLLAAVWLFPIRKLYFLRHVLLLFFILVTYLILPVVGFASMLALLGYAWSSVNGEKKAAWCYLISLGVVQLYGIPWSGWFLNG